jgi:orotate phosphoribosyltransferase
MSIHVNNPNSSILLRVNALAIRDIDAGEEPFLYSSGMKGPGYVMVKGQVSNRYELNYLVRGLAEEVARVSSDIDFIAANATGGMIPGWILAEELSEILSREIPYIYVRGSRKKGGHKELLTGIENNPAIKVGSTALVVEELVNFAETTCNSAVALREAGYVVKNAACILSYGHDATRQKLSDHGVELIHLLSLDELLTDAEASGMFPPHVVADYRDFLKGPQAWMSKRGLLRDEGGGTQ